MLQPLGSPRVRYALVTETQRCYTVYCLWKKWAWKGRQAVPRVTVQHLAVSSGRRDPGAVSPPRPRSCTGARPRTPLAEPSALSHPGCQVWLNQFAENTCSLISPSLRHVSVWAPSAA